MTLQIPASYRQLIGLAFFLAAVVCLPASAGDQPAAVDITHCFVKRVYAGSEARVVTRNVRVARFPGAMSGLVHGTCLVWMRNPGDDHEHFNRFHRPS